MQDRYAGDVGDFQKFGLLRALVVGSPALVLGVNWYLVPDEDHNADGKHVTYLTPGNSKARSLEACDPDLYRRLQSLVFGGQRNVSSLEGAGVLPRGTITYINPVTPVMTRGQRRAWHQTALERLATADLVFVDPDNGLRTGDWSADHQKFAFAHEIADYLSRGQSVVVYHHADRTRGGALFMIRRRMMELQTACGVKPLGTVVAHRGTCRFFFVVPALAHRERLALAISEHASRWYPHTEFHSMTTDSFDLQG